MIEGWTLAIVSSLQTTVVLNLPYTNGGDFSAKNEAMDSRENAYDHAHGEWFESLEDCQAACVLDEQCIKRDTKPFDE